MGWLPNAAPVAYGTFVRRVRQTLTNKTSFAGTSAEQWGTEEATLDDALLPALTNVTVYAEVVGYEFNTSTDGSVTFTVEISLDGGSTWNTGLGIVHTPPAGEFRRQGVSAAHQVTGTVTGDIQARAMCTSNVGAGDTHDLAAGAIYMEVLRAAG